MEKLIDKIDNLINVLDENKKIKEIKKINKKVLEDENLLKLIKEYKETQDEKIKQQIISNNLFKEYKEKETDINIIILEINQKLKEITNKGKCSL